MAHDGGNIPDESSSLIQDITSGAYLMTARTMAPDEEEAIIAFDGMRNERIREGKWPMRQGEGA